MVIEDIELNRVYTDKQYGRDFVVTADVTHPNSERWLLVEKIATGQKYTMQPEQFLRDFEPKTPNYQ